MKNLLSKLISKLILFLNKRKKEVQTVYKVSKKEEPVESSILIPHTNNRKRTRGRIIQEIKMDNITKHIRH